MMSLHPATCAILLAGLTLAAQGTRERLTASEIREVGELVAAADRAAKGEITTEDASFGFEAHFLRAPDGRAYVPFTVVLQDLPADAFSTVALYIRVARRGDRTTSADRNRPIGPTGVAVPVFAFDAAAAASAALRLLDRPDRPRPGAYPFEAAHFTPVWWNASAGVVRRAFTIRPGPYDVYLVIREREGSVPQGLVPRSAVLKREIDVPDFSTKALAMSSPILAEAVAPLAGPLDPDEQLARPYALGTAEIVPAAATVFRQSETPSVVFLVYNAGTGEKGHPDVEVEYSFFRIVDGQERPVGRRLSARFNRDTLPAVFDLRAGHQIVPVQPLPVASLLAGDYRLEIDVSDRVASQTISRALRFTVVP